MTRGCTGCPGGLNVIKSDMLVPRRCQVPLVRGDGEAVHLLAGPNQRARRSGMD
jgi:hypothetical protein